MYFDRFDIVEAYACFFVLYHEGQGSKKYRRLSKLWSYFSPSFRITEQGPNGLTENGREIYDQLVARETSPSV